MIKNIFLYHKNCNDGFGAAWAAWKKFGKRGEYIGVTHGDPYPGGLKGKNVYLLDFVYPPKETKEILKKAKSVTLIDHHISAKKSAKLIKNKILEMNRSGATLAWKYFHPGKKIPLFLRHIEDVDLWNWNLPYSREFSASLKTYDYNFEIWNNLARSWEQQKTSEKYIAEGGAILKDHHDRIKEAVEDAVLVKFCGYRTFVSNSRTLVSEICNALAKKLPPIGIVWSERKDKIFISLRSSGRADVAKLAERFGGGGHKVAAAFSLKLGQKLPWKIIKK